VSEVVMCIVKCIFNFLSTVLMLLEVLNLAFNFLQDSAFVFDLFFYGM